MMINHTNGRSFGEFEEILSGLNSNNTSEKGITKSFRIDEDVIRKIGQQAKNNNNSINAEVNILLRKCVEWDMLASKIGMISIARPVLSEIFQNIITEEEVIDLPERIAKNSVREIAYFMKGDLTIKLFLSWLRMRMEYCSDINYVTEYSSGVHLQIKVIFKQVRIGRFIIK